MSGEEGAPEGPPAAAEATGKPAFTTMGPEAFNGVYTQFTSPMTIQTAVFGVNSPTAVSHARMTGRVADHEIADALTGYLRPRCFQEAESALANDRVVVLHAPSGTGKRAGSFALLREVTGGRVVLLSPQVALADLAERKYEARTGYVVVDHIRPHSAEDGDFKWQVLRDRLAEADAHLVVTTTVTPSSAVESVRHVRWTRPDPVEVLRARLTEPLSAEHLAVVAEVLTATTPMRDVVELARRLDRGESPDAAIGHLDATSWTEVAEWFEAEPSRRRIAEVTTLAFGLGTAERPFESMLAAFERHLEVHMPEPDSTDEVPAERSLPQRRHGVTGPGSLIVRRTVPSDLGPRSELAFRSDLHHRHVLCQLGKRMDRAFWDAVRAWLDDVVADSHKQVALGLAILAEFAYGEVAALLESWSSGSRGWKGQQAALIVLWTTAYLDDVAPAALQTTTRWISGSDTARRWTAAMAFCAGLGVRYPHEATRRLWHLCAQTHRAGGHFEAALAELFGTLARETPDAGIVVRTLIGKTARHSGPGGDAAMRAVALSATLAVLSNLDPVSGRRSFLHYPERYPDRIGEVARLWASVLRNRPTRLRGIQSLHGAVKDIADHEDQAAGLVGRLGAALAAELAADELVRLEVDLRGFVARSDGLDDRTVAALLTALFTALEADQGEKTG